MASRDCRGRRASIFLSSPTWSSRRAGCSTSAAATARCCGCSPKTRGVDARGIELSQRGVNDCVAKGLSVVQGDADTDLADYPDDAFDYVILSQTLQATRQPRKVLEHMLRIGRHAIVSFPNFGHWRIRRAARLHGPHAGHRKPALFLVRHAEHPLLHDSRFRHARATRSARKIETGVALDRFGAPMRVNAPWWVWNLFGEQAVFRLTRENIGTASEAIAGGVEA